MHNWALAILEHAGILTRDQAQKLSDEVKIRIHKENYAEAFREVEAILGDTNVLDEFRGLKAKVTFLEAQLKTLKPAEKTVVAKQKTT